MKNLKYFLLVFVAMILVTGCGKKQQLSCSIESSSQSNTVEYTWENNKISNVKMQIVMDMSAYATSNWDTLVDSIDSSMNSRYNLDEKKKGITFTTKANESKKTYTIDINFDLEKASLTDLASYGFYFTEADLKDTYKNVKEDMEAEGYKCK